MIRTEPILGVENVPASSKWYQQLLGCQSAHGGDVFEILTDIDGTNILSLHKWGEHEHPTLTSPIPQPGNGLILYFRVDNLNAVWENAQALKATVEGKPALNPNSGRQEFSIRDLDGYYISICSDNK